MQIPLHWIEKAPRAIANKLTGADEALQSGDPVEAMLLLAQAESDLLRTESPDHELLSELADLRIRLASLETDKER